ncbi:hypothetical protein L6164_001894 [Bauhinia variegata]|uniref:Uncharacterized protein n=1 Tax=Bauhinia variegata TaxID=167791 RepID=A0ACB9QAV8_BAUVA|nr:hypothetical protein L6164_001894 [Bauhinia variegata]
MESKPKYADAILNGIEIIKLSDSSKNLAASIQLKREQKGKKIPLTIFGATSGAILVLFIACFILIRRSQKGRWGTSWTVPLDPEGKRYKITQLAMNSDHCYEFTFADVKRASRNFNEVLVIGEGGFGKILAHPKSAPVQHPTTVLAQRWYLDPEYYRNRKLTEKSDVYSFGVVLFEVLSGRPAVNPFAVEEEGEKVGLVEWAFHCHLSGTIHRLVDPHLDGKINAECLMAFVDIGIKCLADKSIDRPTMGEVLSNLEKILSLQESWDEKETETNGEQPVHGIGANEEITTNTVAGEHHLNQIVHID